MPNLSARHNFITPPHNINLQALIDLSKSKLRLLKYWGNCFWARLIGPLNMLGKNMT